MDDQVLALMIQRLDRIEGKVDKLMAFRSYMAGVAVAFGAIGSFFHSLWRGY